VLSVLLSEEEQAVKAMERRAMDAIVIFLKFMFKTSFCLNVLVVFFRNALSGMDQRSCYAALRALGDVLSFI
jgi:hypothetical protein